MPQQDLVRVAGRAAGHGPQRTLVSTALRSAYCRAVLALPLYGIRAASVTRDIIDSKSIASLQPFLH